MAKRGSSHKVTRKIQTAAIQNANATDKSAVSAAITSGWTAFSVAGWERAIIETKVTATEAAAEMKGAAVFRFGASIDGSTYDTSLVTAQRTSNAWKAVTMVKSASTATLVQRRLTSCDVAGLSTIKLLGVTNSGSGTITANARLVKAR